ncbi:MAG: hypothetical protein A2289_01095 [Deltaproteobacteria bacterium RIFOXYA12_FULL_58_15]|nr:MAG: hypothetical protein A2289_01095 [Deltaproteobacteria bacterium RIFOXYA12_FULL_58_15]
MSIPPWLLERQQTEIALFGNTMPIEPISRHGNIHATDARGLSILNINRFVICRSLFVRQLVLQREPQMLSPFN